MFLEPSKPQDHVLPTESGDRKEDPFCVMSIPEDQVHDFRDLSGLIGSPIDVEHRNRVGKSSGCNIIPSNEIPIDEGPGCATIHQRRCTECLSGVRGAKFDVEVKGIERRRGGPGNGEVSGEAVSFPPGARE